MSAAERLGGVVAHTIASLVARAGEPPQVPAAGRVPAVRLGPTTQVLPGPAVDSSAPLLRANNNLDVVDHGGARYLAVRTSLVHFASPWTRIVVLRSGDRGATWTTELVLDQRRDLREPRFLAIGDRLLLYCFAAGRNPLRFQPGHVLAVERLGRDRWTEPVVVSPDDSVVWRTKELGGRPCMVRYRGGGDAFGPGEAAVRVEVLTTDDGFDWRPMDPDVPVVHQGGAGETDLEFAADGRLWAVLRNEAGERGRFGSLVATASADDPWRWTCHDDPRKFDSPLMFSRGDDLWLLARRQVAFEGRYDLGGDRLPRDLRLLANQLAYWFTPKRLALWHLDTDRAQFDWVLDLPSRGDTAFPAIVWNAPDRLAVYNYSSPPRPGDPPWLQGQLGPTNIYVTELEFPV